MHRFRNGSLFGRHRLKDRATSRFFGLRKVLKTAEPVSICCRDQIDTLANRWTRPVFWSMMTQQRTIYDNFRVDAFGLLSKAIFRTIFWTLKLQKCIQNPKKSQWNILNIFLLCPRGDCERPSLNELTQHIV